MEKERICEFRVTLHLLFQPFSTPSSTHLMTYSSDSAAQACSLNLQMFSTPHPFLACDGPSLELGFLLMSFSLSGLYSRTVLLTLGPFQALGRMRPFSVWGPVCKANPINSAVPPPPAPARLNHKEPDFLLASFFLSLVFRIPVSCFL